MRENEGAVANEPESSITLLRVDKGAGTLTPLHTYSPVPADYNGYNDSADIHLSPDGGYLLAANHKSGTVIEFCRDAASGKLTQTEHGSRSGGHFLRRSDGGSDWQKAGYAILTSRFGTVRLAAASSAVGMGALGAIVLGNMADMHGLAPVMIGASVLPLAGILAIWLPKIPGRHGQVHLPVLPFNLALPTD